MTLPQQHATAHRLQDVPQVRPQQCSIPHACGRDLSPALLPILAAPADPIPAGASLPAGAGVPEPVLLAALAAPVAVVRHNAHLGRGALLALLLQGAAHPQRTLLKGSVTPETDHRIPSSAVSAVRCPSHEPGSMMLVWCQSVLRECVYGKGDTHQVVFVALLAVALLLDVSRSIRLPIRRSCWRGRL